MTRLIDADAFIEDMKYLYRRAGWGFREIHFSLGDTISNIDNMPTIGAVPARHGKWLSREEGVVYPFWERYTCSACGKHADNTEYCPHCGARMVEDD